ncbi:MAG: helix-turn-helix domain-containing protein [Defluviitaleaceae bacterium]|nr:helix-turn-helix domain-containing protein [Defluviitaleaceae bacterium]
MSKMLLELKNQFLMLDNTYEIDKIVDMKEKFEKYLKHNEDSELKSIENTIYLLKGLINFEETNDIQSSYKLILPMLTNLEFGTSTELIKGNYNRKLLIMCIPICESYEQALQFLNAIEANFVFYPKGAEAEETFKRYMYIRITNRLLHAKGLENLSEEDLNEVERLFAEYVKKAKILCVDRDKFKALSILIAREGLFYGEREAIETGTYMARALREARLQDYLDKGLDQFRALPTLLDGSLTEKEKFGIILRNLRLSRKVSIGEFAGMISLSPGTIRAFEYGAELPRPYTLEKICTALGITEDYFKQDISVFYKKAME